MGYVPRTSGKVHEECECEDCGWSNSNYKNAMATGARHAEATGHTVHCEQGIATTYNPKQSEK